MYAYFSVYAYYSVFTQTIDPEAYNALIKIMILVTEVLNEYSPKVSMSVITFLYTLDIIIGYCFQHGLIQQSLLFQQFASYYSTILLTGFKHTLVPLHGLVVLFSSWYHLLESHSMSFTNLVCNNLPPLQTYHIAPYRTI